MWFWALHGCSKGSPLVEPEPAVLGFRAPVALSTEEAPEGHVLVADANADGWLDVLTWGNETQQLNLSDPVQQGIMRAQEVTGLPAVNVRQVYWLDLNGDKAADLLLIDDEGRLRRFDNQFEQDDPTEYEEVEIDGLAQLSFDTFTLLDIDRDGSLDVIGAARVDATTLRLDVHLGNGSDFVLAKRVLLVGEPVGEESAAPVLYPSDVDNDGSWELLIGADGLGWGVLHDDVGYTNIQLDAGTHTKGDAGSSFVRPDAGSVQPSRGDAGGNESDAGQGDLGGDASAVDGAVEGSDASISDASTPSEDDGWLEVNSGGLRFQTLDAARPFEGSFVIADGNSDGDLDVFRFSSEAKAVAWVGQGNGTFESKELAAVKRASIGCVEDFNNDARLDVLTSDDSLMLSLAKDVWGEFESPVTLHTKPRARRVACVDLDADGDVDILTSGSEGTHLYINTLEPLGHEEAHFYGFRFKGKDGNLAALGTRVNVAVDGRTPTREHVFAARGAQAPVPALHLGLGTHEALDEVNVVWPNGDKRQDEAWEVDVTGTLLVP